ncbi:ricin-type beta-trefoil lectin domain protein [Kitasatospora sp. NPDC001309]|uniref:ricin-type beta-trefoil lectin domain protein n=1 Tax=Kitasatospora sp. NPDC001309 TaxID=3364013 RepID=UPI00368257B0
MRYRYTAVLGVAAALVTVIGASGTANAYYNQDNLVIGSVKFIDHHLGSVYGSYELSSTTYSTGAANLRWKVASAAPDTGYPNVQLRNDSSGRCMRAMSSGTVQMKSCDDKDSYQIWAMTNGAYGTQFFNFAVRSCLDNGNNSPYLFHEEGCNSNNPYQSWYLTR